MKRHLRRIIKNPSTVQKTLSDYPDVQTYVNEKFPDVDIPDIPIYVAPSRVMKKSKFFEHGAGCYIPSMKVILLNDVIWMMSGSTKGRFNRLMSAEKVNTEVEDILVHEMMHAVSDAVNRPGRRHRVDEEEFAYTNCVDFYKNKGMTDADIINKVYLPFCVLEIMKYDLEELCGPFLNGQRQCIDDEFLDKNARLLVPQLLKRAREMGLKMIELYNKWGRGIELTGPPINSTAKRMGTIDFEC